VSFAFPCAGGAGLIQLAGLARPQPGLQPAEAHDDGTLYSEMQK